MDHSDPVQPISYANKDEEKIIPDHTIVSSYANSLIVAVVGDFIETNRYYSNEYEVYETSILKNTVVLVWKGHCSSCQAAACSLSGHESTSFYR